MSAATPQRRQVSGVRPMSDRLPSQEHPHHPRHGGSAVLPVKRNSIKMNSVRPAAPKAGVSRYTLPGQSVTVTKAAVPAAPAAPAAPAVEEQPLELDGLGRTLPFGGLSATTLALPQLAARRETVAAGQTLFDAADAADRVYFIHRGQVRLFRLNGARPEGADLENDPQGQRLVAVLAPEQWFGASALAGLETQGLRAVAHTAAIVSSVDAAKLRQVLATRPAELLRLTSDLVAQQQLACAGAASLIFEDCNQRLLSALLRLSDGPAAEKHNPQDVDCKLVNLRLTHMQLAQYIGVARETVSLALGELRRAGVLATGRNRLTFDPTDLRAAHAEAGQ